MVEDKVIEEKKKKVYDDEGRLIVRVTPENCVLGGGKKKIKEEGGK